MDPATRRGARKWLQSPIHNQRTELPVLFEWICKGLAQAPAQLDKRQTFAHIYPEKPYREAQVNHLMSWLLECLRAFLGWQEWQKDTAFVRLFRARALRKSGLGAAFEKELDGALETLEAAPYRDAHYYQLSHWLRRERFEHLSMQRRDELPPIEAMAQHAALAYQLNQMRFACSAAVAKTLGRSQASEMAAPDATALRLYQSLQQALEDPEQEAAFFEVKKLLAAHWQLFRNNERRDLYLMSLNYCIRRINNGKRNFMRDAFELYRDGLENQALFENGQLSHFTYKNAVTAGLNLGEFEWVRQFIETYRMYLPVREQYSAYQYNLAVWHFWRNDYDEAMLLLRATDFTDPLTNLDARTILLKIYFERGFYDALDSHIDSSQAYLRRIKNIGYQKDNYQNLIRFVRKLLRLKPGDQRAKDALRREIAQTGALAERQWLLKQL